MSRIAVFPGSFDPMTIGHKAILERALPLFDKIIVAIGVNSDKKNCFTIEERIAQVRQAVKSMDGVEIATYETLTTDFCKKCNAKYILRGLRSVSDFEYERNIAEINKLLSSDIETIFMVSDSKYAAISSSMVRELKAFGKEYQQYMA